MGMWEIPILAGIIKGEEECIGIKNRYSFASGKDEFDCIRPLGKVGVLPQASKGGQGCFQW
jgi:hypothetical protein